MKKHRRNHVAAFKAKVALQAAKEGQMLAELLRRCRVHVKQLSALPLCSPRQEAHQPMQKPLAFKSFSSLPMPFEMLDLRLRLKHPTRGD